MDYTKTKLLAFLDAVTKQNLVNTNTAAGWRAAVTRVLEDTPDTEDVTALDVKLAMRRYHNRHPGQLSPSSMKTYESRLEVVLHEFKKYTDNPSGYKGRGRDPIAASTQKQRTDTKATPGTGAIGLVTGKPTAQVSAGLTLDYPLRADFLAQVVVPRDMNTDEARRLMRFILTLAHDYQPTDAAL